MTLPVFPKNDLDVADKLLDVLGSFWSSTYSSNQFVSDLVAILGQETQQTHRQLMELLASISRYTVPVFHTDSWYPLSFLESQINSSARLLTRYAADTPRTYSADGGLLYGRLTSQVKYSVEVPESLTVAKVILDRMAAPAVTLINGIDFILTDGLITFESNPFDDSSIPVTELFDSVGNVVDRQMVLWIYRGQWDWQHIYTQFGYALKLRMQSSEGYRQIVNAVLDAITAGTAKRHVELFFSAAFGIPVVNTASEVVQEIATDSRCLNIITDKGVYQYSKRATAAVAVGDTVLAGQCLANSMQLYELNRGMPIADMPDMVVGENLLGQQLWGELVFRNSEQAVIVEPDVDGFTKLSWALGGFPADVELFWDTVHARGVSAGKTLAMLLDTRTNITDQPTELYLPDTVNPLQFLLENLLRNNVFVLRLQPGQASGRQLEVIPEEQLRKIMPPHTMLVLVVDLATSDAPIRMIGQGTETEPGYSESVSAFQCLAASDVISASSFISERVVAKSIRGRCL